VGYQDQLEVLDLQDLVDLLESWVKLAYQDLTDQQGMQERLVIMDQLALLDHKVTVE